MTHRMDDQNMNRALGNHLVLDIVFSKLALSNLKSCRLVSSKWNELSKNHVVKLSVCKISNRVLGANNDLEAYNRDFSPPSVHIQLKNFHLFVGDFLVGELETFFNERTFVQELTLDSVTVKDDSGSKLQQYNINYLSTALDNLSVLHVVCLRHTKIVIPLSYIPKVTSLYLKHCHIVFDGRIAPTKFFARDYMGLLGNGERLKSSGPILNLNEFVDVTDLKELIFISYDTTRSRLDLTDCLRLENFAVCNTEVSGWHNSNLSSLSRVYIADVPLDLSDLPPCSLVDLDISGVTDLKNSDANIQLINLKQLGFSGQQQFSFFARCPNLEHLRITNDNFDLDNLPTSVKSMTIRRSCEFVGGGGKDLQMDKLVFTEVVCTDNNWERVQTAIERLNPAIVALCLICGGGYDDDTCSGDLSILTRIVQRQMMKCGKFILKLWGCKSKRLLAIPFKGCPICGRKLIHDHPEFSLPEYFRREHHIYENEFGRMIPETDYERWAGLPNIHHPLSSWFS